MEQSLHFWLKTYPIYPPTGFMDAERQYGLSCELLRRNLLISYNAASADKTYALYTVQGVIWPLLDATVSPATADVLHQNCRYHGQYYGHLPLIPNGAIARLRCRRW